MGTRKAKRAEARAVAAEVAGVLSRPVADPLADLSDCIHGCNGDCVTGGGEQCNFTCHDP